MDEQNKEMLKEMLEGSGPVQEEANSAISETEKPAEEKPENEALGQSVAPSLEDLQKVIGEMNGLLSKRLDEIKHAEEEANIAKLRINSYEEGIADLQVVVLKLKSQIDLHNLFKVAVENNLKAMEEVLSSQREWRDKIAFAKMSLSRMKSLYKTFEANKEKQEESKPEKADEAE